MWWSGIDGGCGHRDGRQGGSCSHHWRKQGFRSLQGSNTKPKPASVWSIFMLKMWLSQRLSTWQAIEEGVCHMWTVSAFQQHPNTMIIVDEVKSSSWFGPFPALTFPKTNNTQIPWLSLTRLQFLLLLFLLRECSVFYPNLSFLIQRTPPSSWEWGRWSTSKTCGRFLDDRQLGLNKIKKLGRRVRQL